MGREGGHGRGKGACEDCALRTIAPQACAEAGASRNLRAALGAKPSPCGSTCRIYGVGTAPFIGALADHAAKYSAQVRLIPQATFDSNLQQRHISHSQHVQNAVNSSLRDVLVRRYSHADLERPEKLTRTQIDQTRQTARLDPSLQISFYIVNHALDLPCCKSTPRHHRRPVRASPGLRAKQGECAKQVLA